MNYLENVIEEIRKIETENLDDHINDSDILRVDIVEKTKIYFWIRLFLKEELEINPGDKVKINLNTYDEEIESQFISYGKKGLDKDHIDQITFGSLEDNKKIISLMVDSEEVNYSEEIPHLRKLFKLSHHYQEEIIRHDELDFIYGDKKLDYYDLDI